MSRRGAAFQLPSRRTILRARVAVGASGLVLAVAALAVVLSLGTAGPLDPLGAQSRDVSSTLHELDATLQSVQASLGSAAATLQEAQSSAEGASATTSSLGSAMSELARAATVEVLGVQPFASLAPRFDEIARNAAALATELDRTGAAVGTSRSDLSLLRGQVGALQEHVHAMAAAPGETGVGGPAVAVARALGALLVVWVGIGAGVGLLDALRQLRGLRAQAASSP